MNTIAFLKGFNRVLLLIQILMLSLGYRHTVYFFRLGERVLAQKQAVVSIYEITTMLNNTERNLFTYFSETLFHEVTLKIAATLRIYPFSILG